MLKSIMSNPDIRYQINKWVHIYNEPQLLQYYGCNQVFSNMYDIQMIRPTIQEYKNSTADGEDSEKCKLFCDRCIDIIDTIISALINISLASSDPAKISQIVNNLGKITELE